MFRGIPYAAPPIGGLRFRAPISPIPWNGVKLAETYGPVCPQNHPEIGNETAALLQMPLGRYQQLKRLLAFLTNQSEDCLFLNLYIPGSGNNEFLTTYKYLPPIDIHFYYRFINKFIRSFERDHSNVYTHARAHAHAYIFSNGETDKQ